MVSKIDFNLRIYQNFIKCVCNYEMGDFFMCTSLTLQTKNFQHLLREQWISH